MTLRQKSVSWVMAHRMLLSAFVVSLFIHFLVLNHAFFSFPASQNTHTIVVELARPTPSKTTPPTPKPEPTIKETAPSKPTKQAKQKPVVQPEPPTEPTTHIDPVAESPLPSDAANPTTSSHQETTQIASKSEEPQPEPSPVLTEASMPLPEPYVHVKSEFEVKRGTDKVGKTSVTFSTHASTHAMRYTLESVFTPTGLAALLVKDLTEKSEGYVSEQGIKPESYIRSYGNDPEKEQRAYFAWSDQLVELSSAKGQKLEQLEPGAQDFLSFMYQFMFSPPLNDMQILMTNGKKLKTYVYSFVGEETLTTKFGELKTIHLLKQGDDEEKTEIWLATEYKHIPVQIRKTEKDGTVYEQTITKIFTDSTPKPDAPQ